MSATGFLVGFSFHLAAVPSEREEAAGWVDGR